MFHIFFNALILLALVIVTKFKRGRILWVWVFSRRKKLFDNAMKLLFLQPGTRQFSWSQATNITS